MIGHIAIVVVLVLVLCFGCSFLAQNPIGLTGEASITLQEPRYLSEVFAGPQEIAIPIVWDGPSVEEMIVAVVWPEDTVIISRKVEKRDLLKFYHSGLYQQIQQSGRVQVQLYLIGYKPAQKLLSPPDPIAIALEAVLSGKPEGKYFEITEGEAKVEAHLPIVIVAIAPPTITQIWTAEEAQPELFVRVETQSSQAGAQWVYLTKGQVVQDQGRFVETEKSGNHYSTVFKVPVPPQLKAGDQFVTALRVLDGSGQYADYFFGWTVEPAGTGLRLEALSEAQTRQFVADVGGGDFGRAPKLNRNPPLEGKSFGDKPDNPPVVYGWLDELITRIRGGR